ncbi:hypothetical protein [Winogradskyella sp. 3972H.M.0a.05]|uniref:hypothetical protein n=1 Tax=Winogradskyella sp. 3972H.M.0a.05 TaxID=2950277 RepID=UPI003392FCAD
MHSAGMRAILKNNRNLLRKNRRGFKENYEAKYVFKGKAKRKFESNAPELHERTIALIGERIRRENRRILYKTILVFALLVSVIVGVILYYL